MELRRSRVTLRFLSLLAAVESVSTQEVVHFTEIYRCYLSLHGSEVFSKVWEQKDRSFPFSVYLLGIWEKYDEGRNAGNSHIMLRCDMLLDLLLGFVQTDLAAEGWCCESHPDFATAGILKQSYGLSDVDAVDPVLWAPMVDDLVNTAGSRAAKGDELSASKWISVLSQLITHQVVEAEKFAELVNAAIKSLPLESQTAFLYGLARDSPIILPLLDHILNSRCRYGKTELVRLVSAPPSLEKLVALHLTGAMLETVGSKRSRHETLASLLFFVQTTLLYFQCGVRLSQPYSKETLAKNMEGVRERSDRLDRERTNPWLWDALAQFDALAAQDIV
ncbi:hypothetical protein HDU91_005334 [Kappamyces sp. JEL0680]|nr:hypothetical protein HDU91_005334 [Kappamyces sp. JEL0680]